MPRKKKTVVPEPEAIPAVTGKAVEVPGIQPAPDAVQHVETAANPEQDGAGQPEEPAVKHAPAFPRWIWITISIIFGLLAGFLLCYYLYVNPLNDQLNIALRLQDSGAASSNQIKSDFSNMQLRQQEMEIRYIKSAAQLESANLYIFLLQMKEKTTLAQLYVEQKKGLEARETLADIKTLFNNIYPFIEKKDKAAAEDLDSLITTAVQDLTADPETAVSDLEAISAHLQTVETALFKLE
jgi:hypothetical protein